MIYHFEEEIMKLYELKVKSKSSTAYRTAIRHATKTDIVKVVPVYLKDDYCVKIQPLKD